MVFPAFAFQGGFAVALLAVPGAAWPVAAAELQVPSEYATIQSAVDAARAGDVILVGPGLYAESVLIADRSVQIVGVGGAGQTIVTAIGLDAPVFEIVGATEHQVRLAGLSIRDGRGKRGADGRSGGGVHCTGVALVVESCVLADNGATVAGGGAYVTGTGSATWIACDFLGNVCIGDRAAGAGGGVFMDFETTLADFSDCVFIDNVASSRIAAGRGGAAVVQQAAFVSCTFTGNDAATDGAGPTGGGAVWAEGAVAFNDCLLQENTGTAIVALGVARENTPGIFTACDFFGNVGPFGGAVHLNGVVGDLDSCVFAGNTASVGGGALNVNSGAQANAINCQFDANAGGSGGAVSAIGAAGVHFDTCSFLGNAASVLGGAVVIASSAPGASATFVSCSVSGNHAQVGGGIWIAASADVGVASTIVCSNVPSNVDGPWIDLGGNDICPDGPVGDVNRDGVVDGLDLGILLSQWQTIGPEGDLNNDVIVDGLDLGLLMADWT